MLPIYYLKSSAQKFLINRQIELSHLGILHCLNRFWNNSWHHGFGSADQVCVYRLKAWYSYVHFDMFCAISGSGTIFASPEFATCSRTIITDGRVQIYSPIPLSPQFFSSDKASEWGLQCCRTGLFFSNYGHFIAALAPKKSRHSNFINLLYHIPPSLLF